ncbi:glutamate--tRNA ligase [Candidatus Uhrbacteria bacterium]|nr:glutamate--tRNA ligase [Candidatus Uhrbacteria bacterium]
MNVRTRIAPSPTGYMHIGTLRTVMYDYFLARQHGGQFIVRIEDTDQARLVPDALEGLLKTFVKLGIDYDEGPVLQTDGSLVEKGAFGPYIQSKRLDVYRPYVEQLLAAGHAYVCFCSKERLEEMREAQTAAKMTPKYDRRCLGLPADEVAKRLAAGEAHVVRMKIPEGTVAFDDAIRGRIAFNLSDVDDQIILKSDGFASYHLAVVVDDHLMQISHVLRGEEWISSTPKQIVLHDMLGWDMPTYAHVPLILNPDKTKLSKRKGDVSVDSFLAKGYVPEALINFISTLGFNPKGDQEIYTREELVKLFDLSKVHSSGAVMNMEKLDWMNAQYLRAMDPRALAERVRPFLEADEVSMDSERLIKICTVEKERLVRLTDIKEKVGPYISLAPYESSLLVWKKSTKEEAVSILTNLIPVVSVLDEATMTSLALIEAELREYIEQNQLQNGPVLWPLRVALSGLAASPSPFELLWVLGREEAVRRLETALGLLQG